MKNRIISGAIITIIFLSAFFLGPITFKILVGAVALLAYKEIITLPNVKSKLNIPIIILGLIAFMSLIYVVNDTYALYVGVSYQMIAFMLFKVSLVNLNISSIHKCCVCITFTPVNFFDIFANRVVIL